MTTQTLTQAIADYHMVFDQNELENLTEKEIKKIFSTMAAKCYRLLQQGIHPKKILVFFPPHLKRFWTTEIYDYSLVIDKPPFVALVTKY